MGFTCHTPKKHSTHTHTTPPTKNPQCSLTLHLLLLFPPPPPPPVFDRHEKKTKTTPKETKTRGKEDPRTPPKTSTSGHPSPSFLTPTEKQHQYRPVSASEIDQSFLLASFDRIRGQPRMCYVGKATKIFIFIVTALVVLGLVIGFGPLRHSLRHHSHSHQCSGDSSSCTFSSPVVSPTTPIYPSTPDSGSSSTQPVPSSSNPPPSPTASTTSSYPPPAGPILSPPIANPTAPPPASPSLPLSPPPPPSVELPPPPPPPPATTGAAPPYTSPPSPVAVTPGPVHA